MLDKQTTLEKPTTAETTVGDLVAAFLEAAGVELAFGVISIHNMPMLDAIARRGVIRFVPSRGEAGAVNMADGATRTGNRPAVAFTSTGTAAGNGAGALVEALTASTPLLHFTGQIPTAHLDRDRGYIHEARDQLAMLKAVSKAAIRISRPEDALSGLREALRIAQTPPMGPVSIEIPIDVQSATLALPADLGILPPTTTPVDETALAQIAEVLAASRRPIIWLGGGAQAAGGAAKRLADMGIGIVTSTRGRAIVDEFHPMSLGSFNMLPEIEAFYAGCDAMLVVGSRLRGNETLTYSLALPRPLMQIDADPEANGRSYDVDWFALGDAGDALGRLADMLEGRMQIDPAFADDLAMARQAAEARVRDGIGVYADMVDLLSEAAGPDLVWVRDITLSNSMWGNRLPRLANQGAAVHAVGGGIGQGLPMAIGAALAAPAGRRTWCLSGDGGLQLCLGELATLAESGAPVTLMLMNSQDYGVIKNIQDARYGGRHYYSTILTPDFSAICASMGLAHRKVDDMAGLQNAFAAQAGQTGPCVIELNMPAIGPFKVAFAGPPVRAAAPT